MAVSLLVAAAEQPLAAAGKPRRVNAAPAVTVPPPAPAPAPAPAPGVAAAPGTAGYWVVGVDGGIYAYGAAPFKGSTGAIKLNKPIVGMAPTRSGQGYWLVASDGGIFSFGDAVFRGSTGAIKLNKPIVGMASTPSGRGYWLVASDGGIFSFGDAAFAGSTGHLKLVRPITGMAASPSGRGYWMTASDGGVFSFGDARFFGAARDRITNPESGRGVVAIVPTRSGAGYWQVAASGKIFAFGEAAGTLGGPTAARSTIVGMAAMPTGAGIVPAPKVISPLNVRSVISGPQMFRSAANPTWGTSPSEVERDKAGKAVAVVEAGNRVFVGGEFAGLVPPSPNQRGYAAAPVTARPYLAALDATTGAPVDWDVHPDDAVLALAVSADRRILYVGGRFRNIAGASVKHLAAIDIATGALDPTFLPPALDDPVKTMVVFGDTLYIGGEFTRVGEAARPQLAALNAKTGALLDGFVPPENGGGYFQGQSGEVVQSGHDGAVLDMAITSDGRYLVVGGDFLDFGGRGGVLVVDGSTGRPSAWQPTIDRPVHGLAMWPGDSRTFFIAAGGNGGVVQAFRIPDAIPAIVVDIGDDDDRRDRRSDDSDRESEGAEPLWVNRFDGDAEDVVATNERVYAVGHYDYVLGPNTVCGSSACEGGQDGDVVQRHISAFEATSGANDQNFTAQLNTPQGPYAAHIGARHLYIVGDFTECNGAPQPGFVQFPMV